MKTQTIKGVLLVGVMIIPFCVGGCTSAKYAADKGEFVRDPYQAANERMGRMFRRNSDVVTNTNGIGGLGGSTATAESGVVTSGSGIGGGGIGGSLPGTGGGGGGTGGGGGGSGIGVGTGVGGSIQGPGVGAGFGGNTGINIPGLNIP